MKYRLFFFTHSLYIYICLHVDIQLHYPTTMLNCIRITKETKLIKIDEFPRRCDAIVYVVYALELPSCM